MKKHGLLWFHVFWLAFIVSSGVYLLLHTKGDFSLLLNEKHNAFFDVFFKYVTYLGGTGTAILFTVILLFVRFQYAIIFLINTTVVFLFITGLKYLFDADRPVIYFTGNVNLHYVSGVSMLEHYSFPSGHSANAFCMYFTLAFFVKNPFMKTLFCVVAILVAISRVYLLQHFLVDVFFGSVIAVMLTHTLMIFYQKHTGFLQVEKLSTSLLTKKKLK